MLFCDFLEFHEDLQVSLGFHQTVKKEKNYCCESIDEENNDYIKFSLSHNLSTLPFM